MNFLNLGIPEILFIIIIALIIFGPKNMVKSAREVGVFLRKVTKSPYWQEVWATKRDLDEFPKMLAKEARLNETIQELDRDSKMVNGSVTTAVKEMIKEVNDTANDPDDSLIGNHLLQPPAELINETEKKTPVSKHNA